MNPYNQHETSHLRTTWAQHVAGAHLGVLTTRAAIVRRAIEHYVAHLEGLLAMPADAPPSKMERRLLAHARRETTTSIPEGLITEQPPRPLGAILRDYQASLPTLMDKLKADLARWNTADEDFREGAE